jgi:hypothetical protein
MMLWSESEFTEFENFQNVDSARMIILWILIYSDPNSFIDLLIDNPLY